MTIMYFVQAEVEELQAKCSDLEDNLAKEEVGTKDRLLSHNNEKLYCEHCQLLSYSPLEGLWRKQLCIVRLN